VNDKSRPKAALGTPAKKFTTSVTLTTDNLALGVTAEREMAWQSAVAAMENAGRAMARYAAEHVWIHPAWAELESRRNEDIDAGCGLFRCGGRCSRCVRAGAVKSNLIRYGSDDFPGNTASTAVV
jgi:hypothetical protein